MFNMKANKIANYSNGFGKQLMSHLDKTID